MLGSGTLFSFEGANSSDGLAPAEAGDGGCDQSANDSERVRQVQQSRLHGTPFLLKDSLIQGTQLIPQYHGDVKGVAIDISKN